MGERENRLFRLQQLPGTEQEQALTFAELKEEIEARVDEEKKPGQVKEIERARFLAVLDENLKYLYDELISLQLHIRQVENVKADLFEAEAQGMRIQFVEQDGEITFRAYPKEQMGFAKPLKIEDSAKWQQTARQRQAKRNG